jgi:membrane protease YdiL (CAAX protease family)
VSSPAPARSSASEAHSLADPPLAPRWHTALLIGVILAVAATGVLMMRATAPPPQSAPPAGGGGAAIATVYVPIVAVQWGLVFYVCRVGRSRSAFGALLGETWRTAGRAFTDVGLAALGWIAIEACEIAWRAMTGMTGMGGSHASAILPHAVPERLAWVVVAVSVGICEEIVYRGYLQAQLAGLTGRRNLATVIQAALFGVAHLDQGRVTAARLALYGLGLGVLARWRRSLVPGIVCHVWTDLASGLLFR